MQEQFSVVCYSDYIWFKKNKIKQKKEILFNYTRRNKLHCHHILMTVLLYCQQCKHFQSPILFWKRSWDEIKVLLNEIIQVRYMYHRTVFHCSAWVNVLNYFSLAGSWQSAISFIWVEESKWVHSFEYCYYIPIFPFCDTKGKWHFNYTFI